jgi:hypothetical protein
MTKIYSGEVEVALILNQMRLPRPVILDLTSKVGGERANVAPDEAPIVAGFESWRWALRFSRENDTLNKLGWVSCDKDQVRGIRHPGLGIKLVPSNTDGNTGNQYKFPRNISERGPSGCKLIHQNSDQLNLSFIKEEPHDQLWWWCFWFSEQCTAIEISRPNLEIGGVVTNYSDRIIIAKPGDIPGIRRFTVPQDFAEVPKPKVTRKRG